MSLTILSNDNVSYVVKPSLVDISVFLSEMVKEFDSDDTLNVNLPNQSGVTINRVIGFFELYKLKKMKTIEKPIKSDNLDILVGEEYASIVDLPVADLTDLINAADYLDIPPLLDLCCAKFALLIKGKSEDEILKIFGKTK